MKYHFTHKILKRLKSNVFSVLFSIVLVGTFFGIVSSAFQGPPLGCTPDSCIENPLYVDFSNNRVGIGTQTPSEELEINGNVKATAFLYSSDHKLKNQIETILSPLDKLRQMRGVSFEWKENGQKDMGLIAQEVENVFPELVSTDTNTDLKSVKYGNIVALLIEAIKEQQKEIDQLNNILSNQKF